MRMTRPLPGNKFSHLFHMQMSCTIVNNATTGCGKVLSVARLEMAKYRTKWSYLEDNYHTSGNTGEGGRQMTDSLYSQSSRKKVERKGHTLSKTCKGVITSLLKTQRSEEHTSD